MTMSTQTHTFTKYCNNPYIGVVKGWRNLPLARKQRILQEHPEMTELSAFLERTKAEFKSVTPAYKNLSLHEQRLVDESIENLSFWFIPALPAKIPNGLRIAYATFKSKVPQIANAYSHKPEFLQHIVNFVKKKASDGLKKGVETAKKRTIPTAQSKVDWHVKMVQSGKWKPCHGECKGYYEGKAPGTDKTIYRFKPTSEKHEYEIYKYVSGKDEHWGIFRTEGDRALEILREYAKHTRRPL